MAEENISLLFRLKNIDETRNSFIEEINQNWLMPKNHKSVCATFSHIEHFLILASVSFSFWFCFFSWFFQRLTISAVRLKICAITAAFKKYKSIIKKTKKKYDKILLLAKLNTIGVLMK